MINLRPQGPAQTVVWSPLPGSQSLAVSCPCQHILYEGSRGPGKTDAQLMAFRKMVGMGYGAHWRGIIFDREYKNLDDLIGKSLRWFSAFNDGARFLRSKSDYRWVWPTGEELAFRQVTRKEDYWKYHGQEFTFIGWNELCKFPTPDLYDAMMSCNRSGFLPEEHSPDPLNPLPRIPLVTFSTTNPYGPGHGWVKKRFIDPVPPGQVLRAYTEVFNPQTQQKEVVERTQVRLFGSYKENRYLDPVYIAGLVNTRDVNKRKAWLEGDWNIVAGGAFDDLWDETVHVVPRFRIPASWRLDRAHDWGSTKPFSNGWWALANGEEAVLPDGRIFTPKPGSLIRIAEWYGGDGGEVNAGLCLSAKTVAQGVKAMEQRLREGKWIVNPVMPGPADSSIFDESRKGVDSIAREMEVEGVYWERADKSPGSRKRGLQLVRGRLENALTGEGAALYFMENCREAISQLPVLPRDPDDPDDVDTEAEDHLYDELRYRCLKGANYIAESVPTKYPT